MAFLSQTNNTSTLEHTSTLRDVDASGLSPGFLANMVDIFDDRVANCGEQSESNARAPNGFHGNLKVSSLPSLPIPPRGPHHHFGNNQVNKQMPMHRPFQSPFRVPVRAVIASNTNRHLNAPFPPNNHVFPSYPTGQAGSGNNSHYSPLKNLTCESPLCDQLECNGPKIVAASSFTSLEADTSPQTTIAEVPLTPKAADMEGKKLVMAVSESPNCSPRGSFEAREEMPSMPDSPGPAMFSFDDMNVTDELEGCFGNPGVTTNNFALLPILDDEEGMKRVSPPMMPCLGQSLSWEAPEGEHLSLPDPAQRQTSKTTLKPKSNSIATSSNSHGTQSLFREHAVPFENGIRRSSLCSHENILDEPLMGEDRFVSTSQQSFMQIPTIGEIGRDDHESRRMQSDGGRDGDGLFTQTDCPTLQQQSRRIFPPAISQSFSYSPVPSRPLASFTPPRMADLPGRPMIPAISPMHHPRPPPPRLPVLLQESKNRCHALNHPVPIKFQGDMEEAMRHPLPDFSMLVNFPISLRQNRALPQGTRCCVMCGTVRPTCSRARNRQQKSAPINFTMCDDFVTIPTQNKGLCTVCDISVWVVQETGCQIKWCKGCKNFRQWAFFGEKGLATKCGRCRERQRSKYAKVKEAKKKQTKRLQAP